MEVIMENHSYNFKNLIGKRCGIITIIDYLGIREKLNKQGKIKKRSWWKYRCDCGNEREICVMNWSKIESCGCLNPWGLEHGRTINLTGKKIGRLNVLSLESREKTKVLWKCECVCGKIVLKNSNSLTRALKYNEKNISCGCHNHIGGNKSSRWTGSKFFTGAFISNIKVAAKKRNLEYSLTNKYLDYLFLKQDKKCFLTGLPLFTRDCNKKINKQPLYVASLDRINNSIGYIEGNVQFVHKHINIMKREHSQEYFIEMCKLVANNN